MLRSLGCAVILAGLVAACASQPPAPPPLATDARVILSESCGAIAPCTAYEISVAPNGSYKLSVGATAKTRKTTEGTLPPDAWTKAEAAFATARWDALPKTLPRTDGSKLPCTPGSPRVRFTRRATAGREKTVDYNLGCNSEVGNGLLNELRAAFQWAEIVKP